MGRKTWTTYTSLSASSSLVTTLTRTLAILLHHGISENSSCQDKGRHAEHHIRHAVCRCPHPRRHQKHDTGQHVDRQQPKESRRGAEFFLEIKTPAYRGVKVVVKTGHELAFELLWCGVEEPQRAAFEGLRRRGFWVWSGCSAGLVCGERWTG